MNNEINLQKIVGLTYVKSLAIFLSFLYSQNSIDKLLKETPPMSSKKYSSIMQEIKTNKELYNKACKLTINNVSKLLTIHSELFKQ